MKKVLLALAVMAFSFPAMAQDEALYDPVAPEGSAFVRFINDGDKAEALKPAIGGKTYKETPFGEAGPYVPVKGGEAADLSLGGATAKETLEKGAYYTVLLKGGALSVLKDEALANPAKAEIAFYNLTGKDGLALKTADGKTEVVAPVASGKAGYREINGVTVPVAVYSGADKAAELAAPLDLKRGEATTVIVRETDKGLEAVAAQAKTDTTQ